MYDIYVGKQRSLVFPIMCNSYILIDYEDNMPDIMGTLTDTTDDINYGLWGHEGSFTLECIFTPYDINGMGEAGLRGRSAILTGDKIMPQGGSGKLSEEYLSTSNRYNHEMCIFHNDNFRVTLINSTTTNNNQPAEYKIKVYLTINSVQETYISDTIISTTQSRAYFSGEVDTNYNLSGFGVDGRINYDSIATVTSPYTSGSSITCDTHGSWTHANTFYAGQKIYTREDFTFTQIGVVSAPTATTINLSSWTNVAMGNGTELYTETIREPLYVDVMHHMAVVFNSTKNTIKMFYNRELILEASHAENTIFSFAKTDCLLGKKSQLVNNAYINQQFMGELHEFSLENFPKKEIVYTNTLFPQQDETLLYLRFEEVDL